MNFDVNMLNNVAMKALNTCPEAPAPCPSDPPLEFSASEPTANPPQGSYNEAMEFQELLNCEPPSDPPCASEPPVEPTTPCASEPPVEPTDPPCASEPPVVPTDPPCASEPPVEPTTPCASEPSVAPKDKEGYYTAPKDKGGYDAAAEPPVASKDKGIESSAPTAPTTPPLQNSSGSLVENIINNAKNFVKNIFG